MEEKLQVTPPQQLAMVLDSVRLKGLSPAQRQEVVSLLARLLLEASTAMNRYEPLPDSVLQRKAVVYVRQSTTRQVRENTESQRRQYELVELARSHGFSEVELVDDDQGRSASGAVERPGFDRLVAQLCAGIVGAILCLEASRLSRNGRDWHHLLELCGLVEARVIDVDGIYNPSLPNDRLLLGMKGTISEFELGILRARMVEAARSKARRGELRIPVPLGFVWPRGVSVGFDPNVRVQEVIALIFTKFRELGSARQVHRWMCREEVCYPRPTDGKRMTSLDWRVARYRNVISVLKNPFYAGAYAYGKSEKRTAIVDGRARKSYGHSRPLEQWEILLQAHHEGYITWEEYERNQVQLAGNAYGKASGSKSGRGGQALLAVRTTSASRIHWSSPIAEVSLRSCESDSGSSAMYGVRRVASGRSGQE